jgi:hypothetical protein
MPILILILAVFALVFFSISAFVNPAAPEPSPWRWRLLCLGLACLAGIEIVRAISH